MTTYNLLHKYYVDCFSEGKFDKEKVLEKKLIDPNYETEYRLRLLEKIYKLVLEAKFNNEMSIMYLTTSNRTFDEVVGDYNSVKSVNVNIKTGRSRMIYCSRKINEVFKELEYDGKKICIIEWLFMNKAHMGLDNNPAKIDIRNEFSAQVNEFFDLYGDNITYNKKDLLINIPARSKVSELSEEEFDEFMEIIRPYSKVYRDTIQNIINDMDKEVGYFKYLMSNTSKLNEVDKERRNTLLRWLGKEDKIEEETLINI